jgi:hypothetical protein
MPVLKEISLDVFYEASEIVTKQYKKMYDCTQIESTRFQYSVDKSYRSEFRYYVRSTCALYERFLPNIKDDCWKIIIYCVSGDIQEYSEDIKHSPYDKLHSFNKRLRKPKLVGDGVYDIQIWYKDLNSFFLLSDFDKKKKTLELIDSGINDFLEYKKNWDRAPFYYAHDMVVKNNYDNSYIYGKRALNINTGYKAELFCEHLTFTFNAYIVVRNEKKEIIRKELVFSEKPHEFIFNINLGELVWDDDKTIRIKRKHLKKDILVYMEDLI